MIGLYGPIFFHSGSRGLSTFDQMKKTVSARWGDHAVHLAKPLLEYAGPQLIEISFKMELVKPWTTDPLATIIMLEEIMDLAIPLPLVIGLKPMGRGFSLFVLTSLQHEMKYFYRGGGLMGATVEVQLKEYPTTFSISNLMSALGGVFGGTGGAVTTATASVGATVGAVSGKVSGALGGAVAGFTGTDVFSGALPGALTSVEQGAVTAATNTVVPQIAQNFVNPIVQNVNASALSLVKPPQPPSIPAANLSFLHS